MDNRIFYIFIFLGFMSSLDILLDNLFQNIEAKKCNYDCSKCKNWRCYSNYCKRKRGEK